MLRKIGCALFLLALLANEPGHAHEGEDHSGSIEVDLADDFEKHTTEVLYYLRDDKDGSRRRIEFMDRDPGLKGGDRVKIKVKKVKGDTWVAAADDTTVTAQAVTSGSPTSPGARRTINMRVNFPNATVSCTEATQAAVLFDQASLKSVANYYEDTSNNTVSFYGDVVTVTLPTAYGTTCDYSAWANAADAAAKSQLGIDVTLYKHRIYTLPSSTPCSWGGLGTMPGYRTWVKSCSNTHFYAHELGHNLGMHHAATSTSEYGDNSDTMGNALREVNAPHREQMGWMPASQIVTATADTTVRLAPLSRDPSTVVDPQILKIKMTTAAGHYYFSYRKAEGTFDSSLSTTYANNMSVHKFVGGSNKTYLVANVAPGASFVDAANGIEVTNNASMTDYLEARVRLSGTATVAAPTSLTVTRSTVYPNGRLLLKWTDNATNETGYEVQRSTDGTTFTSLTSLGANAVSYTDNNLTQNKRYYYRVRATTTAASSGFSNVASATTSAETSKPAAPSGLTATVNSTYPTSRINLKWTDNSAMEDGYEIWRSTDNVTFTRVATVAAGSTSTTVTGLTTKTKYYFKVRGYNSLGTGSYSNTASATTN